MFRAKVIDCHLSCGASPILRECFTSLVKALLTQVNGCYQYADGVLYEDDLMIAFVRVYDDCYIIRYIDKPPVTYRFPERMC